MGRWKGSACWTCWPAQELSCSNPYLRTIRLPTPELSEEDPFHSRLSLACDTEPEQPGPPWKGVVPQLLDLPAAGWPTLPSLFGRLLPIRASRSATTLDYDVLVT
jgi:hypothetical protein